MTEEIEPMTPYSIEMVRLAKAMAAHLSGASEYASAVVAQELAKLPDILSRDYDEARDWYVHAEWAIHELETLNDRYPDNPEILTAYVSCLHPFWEHGQGSEAVERKLRRLDTLAARYSTNTAVSRLVVKSLTNVALSDWVRDEFPVVSQSAGQRIEVVANEHASDSKIASSYALLLQQQIRTTADPAVRAALVRRIRDLAAMHPGDQDIAAVRTVVTGQQATGGCYVATSVYGSYDCPEVWVLRRFRDQSLSRSGLGRLAIAAYYVTSPTLVRLCRRRLWFTAAIRSLLNVLVRRLHRAGYEQTPYADPVWGIGRRSERV